MFNRNCFQSQIANRKSQMGFTLVELLVVLGIIVVLVGILVPTISRVREQAQAADTRAQIGALSAAIQAYYGDFNAYPGPVPNAQLRQPTSGINTASNMPAGAPAWNMGLQMSMAENLYLAMLGGLEPGATAGTFVVNYNTFGTGPRWLGATPKKLKAYADNVDVSKAGELFTDNGGVTANDTVIPEFIDRFPERMPLLYLRARVGAPGVAAMSNVASGGNPVQQYDVEQVISYTGSGIGVGRNIDPTDYVGYTGMDPVTFPAKPHGLQTAKPEATTGTPPAMPTGLKEYYPYDLYAALINPNVTRAAPTMPLANTPRQKDAFILISAGIDRVYGTNDDITNFAQ